MQVRLYPRRRGVVPPPGPGELGPHDLQRPERSGRRFVVAVQVDVQDVQVGVDFRLWTCERSGANENMEQTRVCDELHE